MEGTRKLLLVEKISEVVGLGSGDPKESTENLADLLLEKLHQLLHILPHICALFVEKTNSLLQILPHIWGVLVEKFKQTLPTPETLHHWARVGLTVVLPVVLSLLCLYCFCTCCCSIAGGLGKMMKKACCSIAGLLRGLLKMMKKACSCIRRRGGGGLGKMMKAPGRGGRIMPRASFEGNPRGYFINLRANKHLVY